MIKVEDSKEIKKIAESKEINLFYPDNNSVSISINETTSISDLNNILSVFEEISGKTTSISASLEEKIFNDSEYIPKELIRTSTFLTHDVFNIHHSESQLMRYIKKLERKDLSLNHSMISLGSCTMKLNAAAEMLPLSMANWNSIHPFAPIEQTEGYQIMLKN